MANIQNKRKWRLLKKYAKRYLPWIWEAALKRRSILSRKELAWWLGDRIYLEYNSWLNKKN